MKASTAMTTVAHDDADFSDRDVLFRQYISDPLAPVSIVNPSIEWQIRGLEAASTVNMFTALHIRVVQPDGTLRGTILSLTRDDTELATGLTNRRFTATPTVTVNVQANDRLVIEIGLGGDPSALGHDGSLRIGDAAASDLPENDSSTSDFNPWIEFSTDIFEIQRTSLSGAVTPAGALTAGKVDIAALSGAVAPVGTLDVKLVAPLQVGLDARILAMPTRQVGLDAHLVSRQALDVGLDARLRARSSLLVGFDAIKLKDTAKQIGLDARLVRRFGSQVGLDALILDIPEKYASHALSNVGSATQLVVTKPSGVVDGELLLILAHANQPSRTFSWPGGWNNIGSKTSGGADSWGAAWKMADSEPASWKINITGGATAIRAVCVRITGPITQQPSKVVNAAAIRAISSGSQSGPGVTTTRYGALRVFSLAGRRTTAVTPCHGNGYTQEFLDTSDSLIDWWMQKRVEAVLLPQQVSARVHNTSVAFNGWVDFAVVPQSAEDAIGMELAAMV